MRKPRDFDSATEGTRRQGAQGENTQKVQQLGELVIATGADTLTADELAGALIVLVETKEAGRGRLGPGAGPRSFKDGRGEMRQQLTATWTALLRNRAARIRDQAARARHDMRSWQVQRRERARHLIELGGLVVKAGIVDLTGDDRSTILGALIWIAERTKGRSARTGPARSGPAKGKQAFDMDTEPRAEFIAS